MFSPCPPRSELRVFARICNISEIQDGELYRFEVGERTLLVTRISGRVLVTAAICTHEEADLTLGIFQGKTITCPLHQARFDLESGNVLRGPDGSSAGSIKPLKVFDTKIENGEVFANI